MGCDRAELSLLFVDDEEMTGLNLTWRGRDRTTDVLAFSQVEGSAPSGDSYLLGDVVISVETAQRQAKERGATLDEELNVLLVHGVLHLLGYEHEGDAKRARAMRKKGKEILSILKRQDRE